MGNQIVAIDGPAAAGKSTVAREVADQLGALLFDTGTLYRAVTLLALRTATPIADGAALADLAASHAIDIKPPSIPDGRLYDVYLDHEDVTWAIRNPAVDAVVSPVSAHPEVRNVLLDVQRRIAQRGRVVIVGRDIGTVVVPDASVKIFLVASLNERARRRHRELIDRGGNATFDDVLTEISRRDQIDAGREIAPLLPADDATIVATDGRSVPEVVASIRSQVDAAWEPVVARHDQGH